MQFFWALNRVTVASPMCIQWPALDVLSHPANPVIVGVRKQPL